MSANLEQGQAIAFEEDPAPHWRDLFAMLRRRRKLIGICAVAGALFALLLGASMPARYTAKAQLLVAHTDAGPAGSFDEAVVDTHVELILSPSHLREVQKSLALDPGMTGKSRVERPPPPLVQFGEHAWATLLEISRGIFSQDSTVPPRSSKNADAPEAHVATSSEAVDFESLRKNLNVYKERRSRVIAVTFTDNDPQLAALIANRVADMYVERVRERLLERRERLEKELSQQIPIARAALERAEAAIRNHRMASGLLDQGSVKAMDQQIAELRRQLANDWTRLSDGKLAFSLSSESSDADNSQDQLADVRPASRPADIAAGEQIATLRLNREALEERLHRTRQRLETLEQSRGKLQLAEAKLTDLEREAAASAQLYDTLLRRQTELHVQGGIQQETNIVSAAVAPDIPSSPSPILFVLPAALAFAIGGGMGAVLLERIDGRVRSEHDVEAAVGVSCIGLTPKVRTWRLSSLRGHLIEKPFNDYAESIRSIVATAMSRRRLPIRPRETRKCAVFAVASSEKVDGKTVLALSFAVSAATLGQRVLVIDLDFRNRGMADALGKAEKIPATHIGDKDIDRHGVKTNAMLGIDFLLLAGRLKDSFASLSAIQLPSILNEMRAYYDCIVIDSPSLIGATEARAIAAVADNLIFALKWGATDVDTARRALRQLQNAGIKDPQKRVFGVITDVNVRRQRFYR